jgi:hypothetical protein
VEYEVTAVEKPHGVLGHDAITAIGNDRDGWSISTPSAIHRITENRDIFFVTDQETGNRVYITAIRDKFGRVSLRAMTDGRATNHLLGASAATRHRADRLRERRDGVLECWSVGVMGFRTSLQHSSTPFLLPIG